MSDEFFVGYLATPPRTRRFLASMLITLLMALASVAVVIAAGQKDPGAGVWDLEHAKALRGVLYAKPYPMLRADGRLILLVREGKHGVADEEVTRLDRRMVTASGHLLERDGRTLLELDGPLCEAGDATQPPLEFSTGERVVLRGEAIDSKCFTGAMKPGDGKTHKGCVALCLRGGIPPMFVADAWYLLLDERGDAVSGELLDEVIAVVGERVEVRGEASAAGELRVLKISSGSFRRLGP
jgi:hypothetical protein